MAHTTRKAYPETLRTELLETLSPADNSGAGNAMLKPGEKKLTGKQKAAIVLVALGTEIASKVLPHLNDAEVEELSLEIARLGSVPAEVRQQVIQEFYEICLAQNLALEGGLDHARELLERAYGAERAAQILEKLTRALQMLPFDSIKRVHPSQLSTFLQDEHPQTIALVLAYLEPQAAAQVLTSLPPELRPEVAERLATMGSTPPEVIRRVENVLQRKLSSIASQELTAAGGVKSLVEVIQWVDRNTERAIFDYLTDNNPELAEEVRKLMFTFEDLLQLDDRAIQQVLKEVDMKELALALKGASDALKDKIFRNMSERAVNMLKEELEFMGPVRVRDVEEAQQRIVSIVRRMEEAGEIVISRGGEEEMLI